MRRSGWRLSERLAASLDWWRPRRDDAELQALAAEVANRIVAAAGATIPAPEPGSDVRGVLRWVAEHVPGVVAASAHASSDEPAAASPGPASGTGDEHAELVGELMKLHEWVFVSRQTPGGDRVATLNRLLDRLTRLLQCARVEVLDRDGALDDDRHQVVAVEDTDDPSMHNQVHTTVRPGYRVVDTLVRRQQVSVFVMRGRDG